MLWCYVSQHFCNAFSFVLWCYVFQHWGVVMCISNSIFVIFVFRILFSPCSRVSRLPLREHPHLGCRPVAGWTCRCGCQIGRESAVGIAVFSVIGDGVRHFGHLVTLPILLSASARQGLATTHLCYCARLPVLKLATRPALLQHYKLSSGLHRNLCTDFVFKTKCNDAVRRTPPRLLHMM